MPGLPEHDRFTLPGDIPLRQAQGERQKNVSPSAGWDLAQSGETDDGLRSAPARGRGEESAVPTQDWLARGLRHPAGRGWDAEPQSDAALNARLAEYGVTLRPPPGKRGQWPAGWLPGDPPRMIETEADRDPYSHARTFDTPAQIRFLDALARHGEVRAAAALVGVSRETAYRARRRSAEFAALWDAALIHARHRAEAELATRALDGIEVPVMVRGEHVASFRKHDARYLFAHLARLDRHAESNKAAVARAEIFDQLLSAFAGHDAPADFAEAASEAARSHPLHMRGAYEGLPPTRAAYIVHARGAVIGTLDPVDYPDEHAHDESEARAMARAERKAAAAWDRWDAAGAALIDAMLVDAGELGEGEAESGPSKLEPDSLRRQEPQAVSADVEGHFPKARARPSEAPACAGDQAMIPDGDAAEPPMEFKMLAAPASPGNGRQERVTRVNTPSIRATAPPSSPACGGSCLPARRSRPARPRA